MARKLTVRGPLFHPSLVQNCDFSRVQRERPTVGELLRHQEAKRGKILFWPNLVQGVQI